MKQSVMVVLVLAVVLPAVAQTSPPQVRFTGWVGPGGAFPLFNHGTIVMSSDADYTMVYPDMSAPVLRVTSSVPLTATRNIINTSNTMGFEFTIQNATTGGQSIILKGPTGTGATVPNGLTVLVVCDGTNYVSVGGGGGGPTFPFHTAFGSGMPVDASPPWFGGGSSPSVMGIGENISGNLAAQYTSTLRTQSQFTNTSTSGQAFMYDVFLGSQIGSASSTGFQQLSGIELETNDASNSNNLNNIYGIRSIPGVTGSGNKGQVGSIVALAYPVGSGTVNTAFGIQAGVSQGTSSSNPLPGALTTGYNVWANGQFRSPIGNLYGFYSSLSGISGVVTNYYGNYVSRPSLNGGTISNLYAFVTEPNAGSVGINTITPTHDLEVNGTTQTTNLIVTGTCTGCGTGGGNVSWANVTGGTNTGQAMRVGTGSGLAPDLTAGAITANILGGAGPSGGVATGNSYAMPQTFAAGYLQFIPGTGLAWGPGGSGGGNTAWSSIGPAASDSSVPLANWRTVWQPSFAGDNTGGTSIQIQQTGTTGTGNVYYLFGINTSATNVSPFNFTNSTGNGIRMQTQSQGGNIVTVGNSKFVGPLQLTGLNSAPSLATDGTGNIIAGSGGSELLAYSAAFVNVPMVGAPGPIQLTGTGCATSSPWACTAVSPSGNTSYRMVITVTQTAPGGSCSTQGTWQFWVNYTDPDNNFTLVNSPLAFIGLGGTTYATNMGSANNNGGGTMFTNSPVIFRVQGGTSYQFRVQQTVATGCTGTQPTFTIRIAMFGETSLQTQ